MDLLTWLDEAQELLRPSVGYMSTRLIQAPDERAAGHALWLLIQLQASVSSDLQQTLRNEVPTDVTVSFVQDVVDGIFTAQSGIKMYV
jgi:hypothetical protein